MICSRLARGRLKETERIRVLKEEDDDDETMSEDDDETVRRK